MRIKKINNKTEFQLIIRTNCKKKICLKKKLCHFIINLLIDIQFGLRFILCVIMLFYLSSCYAMIIGRILKIVNMS